MLGTIERGTSVCNCVPNILGCSGVTTERLVRCWLLRDRRSSTKIEQHGWRGNRRETSLRYCYQTCYHFLEKAARNRMNQGPTRSSMSLKHKEQHERRRNINQTHNPKVEGSNPSPATKSFNRLRVFEHRTKLPLTPNSQNWLCRARVHGGLRLQNHLHDLAIGVSLGVGHGLAVNVHGRLDAGVTHQLLLGGERSACIVHPGSVAVPEGLPSDPISQSDWKSTRLN